MKPKYRKFYIIEKQAAKKDGSTERLYYAKIDGKVEYESREATEKQQTDLMLAEQEMNQYSEMLSILK